MKVIDREDRYYGRLVEKIFGLNTIDTVVLIKGAHSMKPPQILSGFRDIVPYEMMARNKILGIIKSVFEIHGFEPVETPSLEYYATLTGKDSGECEKLMYDFTDHGDRHIGLIYDLTVPISRFIATYPEIPKPFKRYQIQRVWRAESPQKGRYREFYQCDIDIFGSYSMLADAEIVSIMSDATGKMGFTDFAVHINHRFILEGILEVANVPKDKFKEAIITIDKLDKVGADYVKEELDKRSIPNSGIIIQAILLKGDYESVLKEFEKMFVTKDSGLCGLREMHGLLNHAKDMGAKIFFDPSLARGQSYYTGPIFEVRLESPKLGSLGGGGRYNELIKNLSGQDVPAVGASFGLDRIMAVIAEIGIESSENKTVAKILVCHFGSDDTLVNAIELSKRMRQNNIPTDLYIDKGKPDDLKTQIKYASKRGYPYVAIIGEEEITKQTFLLKDMSVGEQTMYEMTDIPKVLL